MKRNKKALAVFKSISDANIFETKLAIHDVKTKHNTQVRLIVDASIIKLANKKRNLRIQKEFADLKDRYLEKGWPEPSWMAFQKYESSRGRGFMLNNHLRYKTAPKPLTPKETKYYKACKSFVDRLTYKQKLSLKEIL